MFYEANERPRRATTTVAIRSKPIAPGGRARSGLWRLALADHTPDPLK